MKNYLVPLVLLLLFASCKKDMVVEPYEDFKMEYPSYFPEPVYKFENNTQTKSRFELGRKLFYDPILSSDGVISCATCHAQGHAFADHNVKFSIGVDGQYGKRNSPSITNLAWYPAFMWDGGVNHIEVFSVAPITNPLEMNETMANIVAKINADTQYKLLFKEIYQVDYITDQVILRALTQYMAMIVSANSKYDDYRKGLATFNQDEMDGLTLFQDKCASCHKEPLFTDFTYQNNGLDSDFADLGRGNITLNAADNGKFKVPSLRNVTLTYPYMHDGRYQNLNQVLDHYSSGIIHSSTLSNLISGNMNLTTSEKSKIIIFLETLSDYSLLNNFELSEH
ncbi:MAG: cytochrome-c peroxidase [Flavobacteriia bacterium]|jgi:cytochrome c peroxidase